MRTINLIKPTTSGLQVSGEMVGVIRKITYGSLIALIVSGLVVGAVFLLVQSVERQRVEEKKVLVDELTRNTTKEGLLLSVAERSTVIGKILKGERNIRPLFGQFSSVIPLELLKSLSVDEGNNVVISATVPTIPQLVAVVDSLEKHVTQTQAINPQLLSLSMGKDGGFVISFSFTAKF